MIRRYCLALLVLFSGAVCFAQKPGYDNSNHEITVTEKQDFQGPAMARGWEDIRRTTQGDGIESQVLINPYCQAPSDVIRSVAYKGKGSNLNKTQIDKLQPAVSGFKYVVLEIYINDDGKIIQALTRELPSSASNNSASTEEPKEKYSICHMQFDDPCPDMHAVPIRIVQNDIDGHPAAEVLAEAGIRDPANPSDYAAPSAFIGAAAIYVVMDGGKPVVAFSVKRFANNYVNRQADRAKLTIEAVPLNPLE